MTVSQGTLVLACPAMEQQIHHEFMRALLQLIFHCNSHGIPIVLDMISHDPIVPRARNTLAARFLDRGEASHILFLSPTARFSVRQVMFMLTRNVDMLAGPVAPSPAPWRAAWDSEAMHNAPLELAGDPLPIPPPRKPVADGVPGLELTDEASLDFMLIRRSVFTKLTAAYPELHYTRGLGDSATPSGQLYALFDSWIDPASGEYLCGDAAFCRRWKNIGGKIRQTDAPL